MLQIEEFFQPSNELAAAIANHSQTLARSDYNRADEPEDVEEEERGATSEEKIETPDLTVVRRLIAERLYHCLGLLARRSSSTTDAGPPPELIHNLLASSLGLSVSDATAPEYRESQRLIQWLIGDFGSWLKSRGGEFTAGWGEIRVEGEGFSLKAFPSEESTSGEAYSEATYVIESGEECNETASVAEEGGSR